MTKKKLVFISDTHGQHEQLELPKGDILIHAGDVSKSGNKLEVENFLNWFSKLDFAGKVFIAGNHDFYFESASQKEIENLIPKGVIYLNDSMAKIQGISFWGSPIQPWFFDFAFNRQRGQSIRRHWELIPKNVDVLVTHGPPYGILDETAKKEKVGCADLLEKIESITAKIHAFGHIHEAYGMLEKDETVYINASVLDLSYKMKNKPIEVLFKIEN